MFIDGVRKCSNRLLYIHTIKYMLSSKQQSSPIGIAMEKYPRCIMNIIIHSMTPFSSKYMCVCVYIHVFVYTCVWKHEKESEMTGTKCKHGLALEQRFSCQGTDSKQFQFRGASSPWHKDSTPPFTAQKQARAMPNSTVAGSPQNSFTEAGGWSWFAG